MLDYRDASNFCFLQVYPQKQDVPHAALVTAEEVERLIGNAPCKTCQLDPVHLVGEGDACTDLAIFVAVVQQVSDFWLLPYTVQESSGTSTA